MKFPKNYQTLLLIITPFILFFLGYVLCALFIGNKVHQTPQLVGLTLHDAYEKIAPLGVTLKLISQKESTDLPPGTIISQKPVAGRCIKSNQSILVVATKAPRPLLAPMLTQKNKQEIAHIAKAQGLKIKLYEIEHESTPGVCIAQAPSSEQPVTHQKMIAYLAQETRSLYVMPRLTAKTVGEVVDFLKNYTCEVVIFCDGNKIEKADENCIIIEQRPQAGSFVDLGKKQIIQLNIQAPA